MSNQEISKYDALNQPAENKQQQAYQQIKQDILNNTYPEGTVMVERKYLPCQPLSDPQRPSATDTRRSAVFRSWQRNRSGIFYYGRHSGSV
jgi:hypothetical protein